jgi:hypothetical protein
VKLGDYNEGWLRNQRPGVLAVKIVGAVLALSLVICGAGWVFGWFKAASDVVGPDNVQKQWEFAYEYDRSLTAVANNWCTAKKAEDAATGDAKDQRVTQRIAQENLYASRKAQYDAALANAFKAGLVAPPDVPRVAPTLQEKVQSLRLEC